jgi:hypothetical protein
MFTAIELNKIEKTGWYVKENEIMCRTTTMPVFGTRALRKVLTPGDFLALIESPLDDLHNFAWNMYVLKEAEYRRWLERE